MVRALTFVLTFLLTLPVVAGGRASEPDSSQSLYRPSESDAGEIPEHLLNELIRNADALDNNVEECERLCTLTIQKSQTHGDDAVFAIALMQRSCAKASRLGMEESFDDFRTALQYFPTAAPVSAQWLFTHALLFRQRFLGTKLTHLVPMPLITDRNQEITADHADVRVRLLCDAMACRAGEVPPPARYLQPCTWLMPLTSRRELRTRLDFVTLLSLDRSGHPDHVSTLAQSSEELIKNPDFGSLPRLLKIEILLLAARHQFFADNCARSEEHLRHAVELAVLLGNRSLVAACATEGLELWGLADLQTAALRMETVREVLPYISCTEVLNRLQLIVHSLPSDGIGRLSRATWRGMLDHRISVVESQSRQTAEMLSLWNTSRVNQMLRIQSQRISEEQVRADTEGRRSLLIARVGFGICCVLAVVLWRERRELRLANLRLELEITNANRQRMEKERIEMRLAQTERLESLGSLAGGIAHDFNNLLVGVIGNADLLRHLEQMSPAGQQCLDGIMRSAETAASLSRKMLAYAGRQPACKKVIDINETIGRMLPLLKAGLGGRHQIEFHPASHPVLTEGDSEQLDQILLNLVTNAFHAMQQEFGKVSIRTGTQTLSTISIDVPFFGNRKSGGEFVWFEVEDNGTGISESDLARVFEPFYTTKAKNTAGHGFGLAVVYGHVNRHDGLIQLSSKAGWGTCFRILLPRSGAATACTAVVSAPAGRASLRTVFEVVAVDDQPEVLEVVSRAVHSMGGRAVCFTSATDAMEYLMEHRSADYLILDVVMPILDGPSMLEELVLREIRIPVILMSGYSSENLEEYASHPLVKGLLQKPFLSEELFECLRRAESDVSEMASIPVTTVREEN